MSSASQVYIPTSTTPQLVIQNLGDYIGEEIGLPGNWSPTIFYNDLKSYPVKSKRELGKAVLEACQKDIPYLKFFEEIRGQPRPCNEFQKQLWDIFSHGSIMLYFESLFLRLLETKKVTNEIHVLVLYLNALSQAPISQWDDIVKGVGACCYQYFAKEPELYAELPHRKKADTPDKMTDQEMLDLIDSNLSPTPYRGKISIEDSRSQLIQQYQSKIQN